MPILSLILSCSYNDKQVDLAITKAEELLDVSPDSSLAILDKVDSLKTKWHTSQQMRYELVRAQAQNKAYINFSTDSILKEVVDYYDTYGTANERMTARYMLGCAYRDMEDAPAALKYFNLATDIAEQDRSNCNPTTLMKIHSQMGGLYQNVGAYDMALSEDSIAEHIARQIGDTTSFIHLMWTQACSLESMNQNARAKDLLDSITVILTDNNLTEEPVLIYPMMIDSYWKNKDTNKAEQLLLEYERKTGMSPHCPDEEVADMAYFYRKGRSYLAKTLPDSAKLMFDRLCHLAQSTDMRLAERYRLLEASYYGLKESYIQKHQLDSAIKYADLYCQVSDTMSQTHDYEQLLRLQSLYNYTKAQEIAFKSQEKVTFFKYLLILLSLLVFILVSIAYSRYQKRMLIERHKLIQINTKYKLILQNLDKSTKELHDVRTDYNRFIDEKQDEIQKLQQTLLIYQNDAANIEERVDERTFLENKEVKHLHNLAIVGKSATPNELAAIRAIAKSSIPNLYRLITAPEYELKDYEIDVCILMRMQFVPTEIAILKHYSMQRVTNIKSSINNKLFGAQGARTLGAHLQKI